MTVTLRPAIADDFAAVGGEAVPVRTRAKTIEIDGVVAGVGGVGHLPDGAMVAFGHFTDELRKKPLALHKAALGVLREARARSAGPIVAKADPGIPRAEAWLDRLGFKPMQVGDKTVWVLP